MGYIPLDTLCPKLGITYQKYYSRSSSVFGDFNVLLSTLSFINTSVVIFADLVCLF